MLKTPNLFQHPKQWMRNGFLRNIGWLSLGMIVTRVFRLGITVMVARTFAPEAYGQIALVFTVYEVASLLMQRCTTVKLVQAPAGELPGLCRTTYKLNWALAVGLMLGQCLAGGIVSRLYEQPQLLYPICLLGISHLIMPMGMIHCALNVRAGKMDLIARIDVCQTFIELLVIGGLLAIGLGIWALIIPKALIGIIWVIGHRSASAWRYRRSESRGAWRPILRYSSGLLFVDGLQVLRQNADYLIVGYVLGIEALGLYFFAFNAGLGIATTFAGAINSALLPHLCQSGKEGEPLEKRFISSLKVVSLLVGSLVLVQSSMATIYVPLVFGEEWAERGSVPLIVILCLAALPKTLFDSGSQYLRALDHPARDVRAHVALTGILLMAIGVGVHYGPLGVAAGVLTAHSLGAAVMLWQCLLPPHQTIRNPDLSATTNQEANAICKI